MTLEFSDLKRLNVRNYWTNESAIFTPWLAKEENVAALGKALGIELEVEGTEVSVGPYSADILARDLSSSGYVVIENQLRKTDHDHLGKAITYSAVLDAEAIVWIAADFTEEHKKALDWLNDNSTEDVSYFGVRIEVWQIDDSRPAVRFNVVSWPADFARRSVVTSQKDLSPNRRLQLEWWQAVRTALLEKSVVPSARKARAQYWYDIGIGRTGFVLSCTANTYDLKIGVRLYMRHRYNATAGFPQLMEQRKEIEEEIDQKLLWDPNPEASDKTIGIYHDADLNKKDKWDEYLDWMVGTIDSFRKVFSHRVKDLELDFASADQMDD